MLMVGHGYSMDPGFGIQANGCEFIFFKDFLSLRPRSVVTATAVFPHVYFILIQNELICQPV